MYGVSSDGISYTLSHGPSLDIRNVPCSHLLESAPCLLTCYAMRYANVLCTKYVECVMHQIYIYNVLCTKSISRSLLCTICISTNVLRTGFTNVYCNEIDRFELVKAHNYFLQIVHAIKWSSYLSLWCQYSIAQCRRPLVLCLHPHDL